MQFIGKEPGNDGIIELDILMKHQPTISPATAKLIEIKSSKAAKLFILK